jgi:hypothetical protein
MNSVKAGTNSTATAPLCSYCGTALVAVAREGTDPPDSGAAPAYPYEG